MTTATATEVQNNFGRFLQSAIDGNEVVILKNGKEVARLVSHQSKGDDNQTEQYKKA